MAPFIDKRKHFTAVSLMAHISSPALAYQTLLTKGVLRCKVEFLPFLIFLPMGTSGPPAKGGGLV